MSDEEDGALLISRFDAYGPNAYWKNGSWCIGYADSTTEGPDGAAVQKGMVTTPARAMANLVSRMAPIKAVCLAAVGGAAGWAGYSREQRAVLMDLVWSYGFLPIDLSPDVEVTALRIEARAADYNGRDRIRRKAESQLYVGALSWIDFSAQY